MSCHEYEVQTMLRKNMKNKILIQTLNIGIKNKKDDAVLFKLPKSSKVSIVATKNKFAAAPVIINRKHMKFKSKFLLVNSGNANAGTGNQGIKNAIRCAKILSKEIDCNYNEILLFSTGIIGQQLPMKQIEKKLHSSSYDFKASWVDASKAIMTTDKFNKIISKKINICNKKISVNAICKGAGMIEPNMATMLSFVSIDLAITKKNLDLILKRVVNKTFNIISVDGDMSTNDSVVLISTGENSDIQTNKPVVLKKIESQLEVIFMQLAEMIVRDGEGATKIITINVLNAKNNLFAKKISYSIANSNLFKTAMYGSDANWGRIIARLGSLIDINFIPSKVKLYINDILVFKNETNTKMSDSTRLKNSMKKSKIKIDLLLNNGKGSYTVKTSDLTKKYVHLNSAYPS